MALPGQSRLASIQILRGIAASLVVFHHFSQATQEYLRSPSWIVNSGLGALGKSGVDFFFVISGFIMVYTTATQSGGGKAASFLKKRALRIYPIYWFWTTVLLLLWLFDVALKSHHYPPSFIVASFFLMPAYNGVDFHPLLDQGWTLSFEMLFYAAFSVAIWLGVGRYRIVLLAFIFGALAALANFLPRGSGLQYLFSNPIIIEFLFGVVAAEIFLKTRGYEWARFGRPNPGVLIGLSLALLLSSLLYTHSEDLRFIVYGIPGFFMVLGLAMWESSPTRGMWIFLGNASYSIYLTHGFLSLAYSLALKNVPFIQKASPDLVIIGCSVATIFITSLAYLAVERPISAFLSRRKETGKH